jgi:NADH-quinone oxidoreductase subunit L
VQRFPRLHRWVHDKYYVDELYQWLVVNNLLRLNNFMAAFDQIVIDGFVNLTGTIVRWISKITGFVDNFYVDGAVNLTANSMLFAGSQLRKVQTGRIQNYLYGAMAGVLVLMIWKLI